MRRALLLTLVVLFIASPVHAQQKEVMKSTGWGRLSGKVTFEGDLPPVVDLLPAINKLVNDADKACCNAAPANQKMSPNWMIDPKSKGIANVVIWIKPAKDSVFPIHKDDMVRKENVVIDQPFCSFLPHMVALYPQYHDGMKDVPTGQKFIVKNSAKVAHNVRTTTNLRFNDPVNILMPANSEREFAYKPQPLPITFQCDLHGWMKAYVCVFGHPYFAVTRADGSFTIPRVPAGTEVTIMAWHGEVFLNALDVKGKKITLKEGENEFSFSIKAK